MFPLSDSNNPGRFPIVTFLIILANALVFFLELTAPNTDAFISQYALIPANINLGDPATLIPFVTSQFLHGGWFHIIGNMLFLWVFGDNIEGRFGILYLPFYLLSGIIAGLAQCLLDPHSSVVIIGASGAIAGILGSYLILFPKNLINTLVFIFFFVTIIKIPAPIILIYWFATQILSGIASISSVSQGDVAYFAHIGGFVFGIFVGLFVIRNSHSRGLGLQS
jgi:membrane associated rhomboid family serine protease